MSILKNLFSSKNSSEQDKLTQEILERADDVIARTERLLRQLENS